MQFTLIVLFPVFLFTVLLSFDSLSKINSQTNSQSNNIFVIADRHDEEESSAYPPSTSVLSMDENKFQPLRIFELLNIASGLNISNLGNRIGPVSVNIRGGKTGHTLVLIDGVRANNPITPGRQFRFSNLTTLNIERVEIFRGGNSVLYGSDAISGVINIVTKKGSSTKKRANYNISYGSHETVNTKVSTNGSFKTLSYLLGFEREASKGFSAINSGHPGSEKDGYELLSFNTKLNKKLSQKSNIELNGKIIENKLELDDSFSVNQDDPNYESASQEYFSSLILNTSFFNGLDRSSLSLGYNRFYLNDHNLPDPVNTEETYNKSRAVSVSGSLKSTFYISPQNTTSFGVEYEEESGHINSLFFEVNENFSPPKIKHHNIFLHHKFSNQLMFLTVGSRINHNPSFRNQTAWQIENGYNFFNKNSTVFWRYSKAFKTPTLFQLYSQYGNRDLVPETSEEIEIGMEQKLADKLNLKVFYFKRREKKLIDAPPPSYHYQNIGEGYSKGLEIEGHLDLTDDMSLSSHLTYLKAINKSENKQRLRIPKTTFSSSLSYVATSRNSYTLSMFYKGRRDDTKMENHTRIQMPSYTLFSLSTDFSINSKLNLWLNINNLLDKNYEDIDGYQTSRRSFTIGLSGVI